VRRGLPRRSQTNFQRVFDYHREANYGHFGATRFTVVTLMPSAPPSPIRSPLTAMREPDRASSLVTTLLSLSI
jgi:hypothetical protein